MLAMYYGNYDYWELQDKVTFDYFKKIIIVNPDVVALDIKSDVYSAWKRWCLVANNNQYRAIRVIGGDATVGVEKAGDIYFLVNGWRLQVNLSITAISGVLFSDDFETPLIDFAGSQVYSNFVSNLVSGIDVDTITNTIRQEISTELAEITATKVTTDAIKVSTDVIEPAVVSIETKVDSLPLAVWNVSKANLVTSGSIGEFVAKQIVTLKEWYSQ